MTVYDVQALTKFYPKQARAANREVSLQIQEGEIFGLLGDNGAGKTTLVRQMVNLLRPTSGQDDACAADGQPAAAHLGPDHVVRAGYQ
jgi:ABC-type multidrug transport system ATPase subunit